MFYQQHQKRTKQTKTIKRKEKDH